MIKLRIFKIDAGYKARIVRWDGGDVPATFMGTRQMRQLAGYPAGTYITALVEPSLTGRLMIKKHEPEAVNITTHFGTEEELSKMITENTRSTGVETMNEEAVTLAAPAQTTPRKPLDASEIATLLTGYHVNNEARSTFAAVYGMSQKKPDRAIKLMMVGPSGFGKTTMPKLFADIIGLNFMRMNCGSIRDPEEWFGYREAQGGSTVFIRSRLMQLLTEGNCVVVLDEFNRLEPWLHNTLFPLLDDDGFTFVHDEEFRIGPNVIFVGTINTGYKYTGTFELDEALLNRFEFVLEVGPLASNIEEATLVARTGISKEIAKAVVKVAGILRQNDAVCSTRTTLNIGFQISAGMGVREAFETSVVRRIPVDSAGLNQRKAVVDRINAELGPYLATVGKQDIFRVGILPQPEIEIEPEMAMSKGKSGAKVATFILQQATGKTVNTVNTIRLIRKLPCEETLAFPRAQALVNSMAQGKSIAIPLTVPIEYRDSPEFKQFISDFKESNVSGRFGMMAPLTLGVIADE